MHKNDYLSATAGCASIYVYEMSKDMLIRKRRSFNNQWNLERSMLKLPEHKDYLNPIYVGFTGKKDEPKTVYDRIEEHLEEGGGGKHDLLNHGLRNEEFWPGGLKLGLMDEIPDNTKIALSNALSYEIATGIEMAKRGFLVFGPSVWQLKRKKRET